MRRARGYTLIEVLVAFVVLALALTVLVGTLGNASRQVRLSADASRATLHAQSLLDQLGVDAPLREGEQSGVFDEGRYRWRVRVAPFEEPAAGAAAPRPVDPAAPRLLQLDVDVDWGKRGPREQLRLRTLRLVLPDPLEAAAP